MVEATAQAGFGPLEEFLDTLPVQPCKVHPENRYYCTVCERLNKSVAGRCSYSKLELEAGSSGSAISGSDEPTQFIKVSEAEGQDTPDAGVDKVEFKIVAPMKTDEDYPLIELVQPKDKKIEPIEMELLEDVAIEFELGEDEPFEVDVLEVLPIDESEDEFSDDDIETAEVIEVEVIEADDMEVYTGKEISGGQGTIQGQGQGQGTIQNIPQFKPIYTRPKPIVKSKIKKAITRKPIKKIKKTPGQPQIKRSVKTGQPTLQPTVKHTSPKPTIKHIIQKQTPTLNQPSYQPQPSIKPKAPQPTPTVKPVQSQQSLAVQPKATKPTTKPTHTQIQQKNDDK